MGRPKPGRLTFEPRRADEWPRPSSGEALRVLRLGERKGTSGVELGVAKDQASDRAAATGAPARPYDEMRDAAGQVRSHYAALADRLETLSAGELTERQRTLERFFLLQGITFTVYGAESSTDRII